MEQANTTLAALRNPSASIPDVRAGFDTAAGFDLIQRTAKLFAASDIVPAQFKGNLPNCVIAVDMALRMGANPLMVCQNLYIVHGRPAWSAQFLIATLNQCGRFSSLRYDFQGTEGQDDWGCRAVAIEFSTKEKIFGPLVTIGLAKKEGWHGKSGSKWQTMPELMLRYRAASWFVRAYAPEIAMGLYTAEEVHDKTFDLEQADNGVYTATVAEMKKGTAEHNPETGEVADVSATTTLSDDEKTASKAEREARKAELEVLRESAKAAWESTGLMLEDAEKMVNEFIDKWNTTQCQKVLAAAHRRHEEERPQEDSQEIQTLRCSKLAREVTLDECRSGCPDIETCAVYREATE